MNAFNQYTKYTLGNGIQTINTYNNFGITESIQAGSTQNMHFIWDNASGNLNFRSTLLKGIQEEFGYDNLNRLTSFEVNAISSFPPVSYLSSIGYANNGNITSKTDAGIYTYDPNKPHAVQSVTDPDNLMPLTQNITYTPFKRPETITEGDYELEITYGAGQQRKKSVLKFQGNPQRTVTYAGTYEKIETGGDVYEVHYIVEGPGLIAINVRKNNGADQLYLVYSDHLGSILTITDDAHNVIYEQSFDPWGRERNPNRWDYTANPNTKPAWLIRGFTGHEHHDEVQLINMNARLYDPIVARMLSPDNFVQDNTSTQGYNRYSYVINNPLVYTDPDGEFIFSIGFFLAAFVEGALFNATISTISYLINTEDYNTEDFLKIVGKEALRGGVRNASANALGQVGVNLLGSKTGPGRGGLALGYQAFSTTASSALGNLAVGDDPFSYVNIGVGAFTVPIRDGKFSFRIEDQLNNLNTLYYHGRVLLDAAQGNAKLSFDPNTLRLKAVPVEGRDGYVARKLGKDLLGFHTGGILFLKNNYSQSTLYHEGIHAIQAGFSGGTLTWSLSWRFTNLFYDPSDDRRYVTDPWEKMARFWADRMISNR